MTEKQIAENLHEEFLQRAKNYQTSESALIETILKVDAKKSFQHLGYSSLHSYCTLAIGLSDSHAYALISVARKSRIVPEIMQAIDNGEMHLSNARRITSVITPENKDRWLEKAKTLSQRKLEEEIVKEHPLQVTKPQLRPLTETVSALNLAIPNTLAAKLKKISDLLSQKKKMPVALVETLESLCDEYIERHDPIEKAKRSLCPGRVKKQTPQATQGRKPLPMPVKHAVALRDNASCVFILPNGMRCEEKRFLERHHLKLVSEGGANTVPNIVTLCYGHRMPSSAQNKWGESPLTRRSIHESSRRLNL